MFCSATPDVEEAPGEPLNEGVQGLVAEVPGQQQDAWIALGQVGQRFGKGPSHAPTPISVNACRYSSSVMGQ